MRSDAANDIRYAVENVEQFQIYVAELLALKPDVLIADATPSTSALQHATRAVPIVFARVTDPVGARLRRKHGTTRDKHYGLHKLRRRDGQ
jgi:ABC-type uncharacterized transport system substrate-binding protein